MKTIYSRVTIECLGRQFHFNVTIMVDSTGRYYRFNFVSEKKDAQKLPEIARCFDIITDYKKQVVFNKLRGSENEPEKSINTSVLSYIQSFSYPDIMPKDS